MLYEVWAEGETLVSKRQVTRGPGLLVCKTYLYPPDLPGPDPSVPFFSFSGLSLCLPKFTTWSVWHTQLMMGICSCIVSWCPLARHSFSPRAQEHARSCFLNGELFSAAGSNDLHWEVPLVAFLRLKTMSLLTTAASSVMGSGQACGPRSKASGTIAQNCFRALFCCGPHSKVRAFQVTIKWIRTVFPSVLRAVSKNQRELQNTAPLF